MTIEKGKDWGEAIVVPDNLVVCHTDAEVAGTSTVCVVVAGDLFRCLGSPRAPQPGSPGRMLPVDGLSVTIDHGTQCWALSTVEVGTWWSRAPYVCVSNTGFVGDRNLTPRSHPNDGRFEVVTLTASLRQRMQIDRRSRSGTHLPHPQITVSPAQEWTFSRTSRSQQLRIDGAVVDAWTHVSVTIAPDHFAVVI